jgi:thioredoxin-related protein
MFSFKNNSMYKGMVSFLVPFLLFLSCGSKPASKPGNLNWMTIEEVNQAMKVQKRPILVDLYTDWCYWCKVMDKKTYTNKKVIEYLETRFYSIKLNAETREKVSWEGKVYSFNPSYKTNDIALYFTGGQLAYPTTVIIPPDGSGPQAIPGYLTPKDIEIILKYFGEDKYGKVSFEKYRREFKPEWK